MASTDIKKALREASTDGRIRLATVLHLVQGVLNSERAAKNKYAKVLSDYHRLRMKHSTPTMSTATGAGEGLSYIKQLEARNVATAVKNKRLTAEVEGKQIEVREALDRVAKLEKELAHATAETLAGRREWAFETRVTSGTGQSGLEIDDDYPIDPDDIGPIDYGPAGSPAQRAERERIQREKDEADRQRRLEGAFVKETPEFDPAPYSGDGGLEID
jgi:hypothetical protein